MKVIFMHTNQMLFEFKLCVFIICFDFYSSSLDSIEKNLNQQAVKCSNPRLRPDISELKPEQLTKFVNAFKKLNQNSIRPNEYDNISNLHIKNSMYGHGNSQFLPWHREYLKRFEQSLQSVDPDVDLPYWDWSKDYSDPANSYVMKHIIGTNGNRNNSYCVQDGMFANFTVYYPTQHCVKREFDKGDKMSAFYSTQAILNIINSSSNFSIFSDTVEALPHATVHINMGSNVGDMNFFHSPNDIAFWLHHAFIDKMYYEWQQIDSNKRENRTNVEAYNGVTWDNNLANLNEEMLPFGVPVNYVVDTNSERLCYYYKRFDQKNESNIVPSSKTQLKTLNSSSFIENNIDDEEVTNLDKNSNNIPRKINQDWWIRNNIDPNVANQLELKFRPNK